MESIKTVFTISSFLFLLSACGSSGDSEDTTTNGDSASTTTKRLVESTRSNADGSVVVITTGYSDSGTILSQTFKRDGQTYLATTFEASADGQLIRRSSDVDQDGIEDFSSSYEYEDGLGLSRIYRVRSDDMLIYEVVTYQFEDSLAVSRDTQDIDDVATLDMVDLSSGTLAVRREFTYENDQLSLNSIDTDGDGAIDRQETYSYNPDGTLATTVLSSLSEGVITTSTHVYETGVCNNISGNSSTKYFCIPQAE